MFNAPVRVLLVNKFLAPRGGAESVVLQTRRLLEAAGHEVIPFGMRTDAAVEQEPWTQFLVPERQYFDGNPLRRARDAVATVYSLDVRSRLRALLRHVRPDIAHLHNVYHQLTLSVVDELKAQRIPMVMTLHDYKVACPAYQLLTHDGVCERCVGGAFWHVVRHRCLKSSIAGSVLVAVEAYLSRARRQYEKIDRFLAPSRFLRDVVVRAGLPANRIAVLPNAVAVAAAPRPQPESPVFLFAGRLSAEKGIDTLLEAAGRARAVPEIRIAGAGPLEALLRDRLGREGLPIRLLGFLGREQVVAELSSATAALVPSKWYENCPLAILEAAALGVPTIASDIGGIPELITSSVDGILVPPGDSEALAQAMDELARDRGHAAALGRAAYERVQAQHCEDRYLQALLGHYEAVVAGARHWKR